MHTRSRLRRNDIIWPGFVDALSTLLLALIFLLVVLMLAQFLLNQALTGRDEALTRLDLEVAELAELLALEQQSNTQLQLNMDQLSATLSETGHQRDHLAGTVENLVANLGTTTTRAETAEQALLKSTKMIVADKEKIALQLNELAILQTDVDTLIQMRRELENTVMRLASSLDRSSTNLTVSRDQSKMLKAELLSEQERTLLAQAIIKDREIQIEELDRIGASLRQDLFTGRLQSASDEKQVELLNQQVSELREQLTNLEKVLEFSEAKDIEQQTVISDLGKRLNVALARKVEELSKYRSEFFGRLREVLGNRRDVMIVGDRFVFQSEVLFSSGSAHIGTEGQLQLAKLADTLLDLSADIPPDIPWILRIDGHTDRMPISTTQFPSNWELSTSRAISVARFLITHGIPADRVAVTGFAEYQPLDQREDEIAFRRNRRIELKLTER